MLTGPEYEFSKRPTHTPSPSIPDSNCHLVGSLILVIGQKESMFLKIWATGDSISRIYDTLFYAERMQSSDLKSPSTSI
ncbi:kinase-like domain-containing protein [Rhizophagus irregularis DAOM 181602=DAOM 197198]|uniref:Uncharacterized protein n=1 Tax=Rhizophagus irregularis (strain DAOM 197198w) TaxID=1432141 RepID=A0A015JG77_RHIIW|nr:hypothetical protein RirG_239110 [Rhizophagus irregularis DAOM 197198w]GBC40671.1 kinase-like domain-containing protein [Rhizophagus irregularis DAOM 181602=DAOM 197198]